MNRLTLADVRDLLNQFPGKGKLVGALLLSLLSALFAPVITGKVVDHLSISGSSLRPLFWMLLVLFALTVLTWVFRYVFEIRLAQSSLTFEKKLRLRIWDALSSIPIGEYEAMPRGSLHSKMSRDVYMLSMAVRIVFESVFTSVVFCVWAIAITAYRQPEILLVVAIAFLLNLCVFRLSRSKISTCTHEAQEANEELHRVCYDMIEMLPMFRSFSVGAGYRSYFSERIDGAQRVNCQLNRVSQNFSSGITSVSEAGRFFVFVSVVVMYLLHKISLGDIVLYQMLFSQSLDGLCRTIFLLPNIEMGREALLSICSVSVRGVVKSCDAEQLNIQRVKFENVHFSYPGTACEALSDVNVEFFPRQYVVIVGKNGSGKSTLAKLLLGYYEPKSGSVLIDGIPASALSEVTVARSIAYVPQVSQIYRDSLLENIRLRDERISREEILRVAKLCNLTRLISRLSHGLDEFVTPVSLSGGEMQCIAMARALVRNPKIVLLDEVTSHLDIYSKRMVLNVINALRGSHTVIAITHDIEFIERADRVLIVDDGKLYEGTRDAPHSDMSEVLESIRQSSLL